MKNSCKKPNNPVKKILPILPILPKLSICLKCGSPINSAYWESNKINHNLDGTDHLVDCKKIKLENNRKKKQEIENQNPSISLTPFSDDFKLGNY